MDEITQSALLEAERDPKLSAVLSAVGNVGLALLVGLAILAILINDRARRCGRNLVAHLILYALSGTSTQDAPKKHMKDMEGRQRRLSRDSSFCNNSKHTRRSSREFKAVPRSSSRRCSFDRCMFSLSSTLETYVSPDASTQRRSCTRMENTLMAATLEPPKVSLAPREMTPDKVHSVSSRHMRKEFTLMVPDMWQGRDGPRSSCEHLEAPHQAQCTRHERKSAVDDELEIPKRSKCMAKWKSPRVRKLREPALDLFASGDMPYFDDSHDEEEEESWSEESDWESEERAEVVTTGNPMDGADVGCAPARSLVLPEPRIPDCDRAELSVCGRSILDVEWSIPVETQPVELPKLPRTKFQRRGGNRFSPFIRRNTCYPGTY